jgi:hypothetical protein
MPLFEQIGNELHQQLVFIWIVKRFGGKTAGRKSNKDGQQKNI